ncbi:tyrosyl-DNA phosphodiesterase 2 [Acipenser ruthenus]|uniref:tyrosyl-DNA phosphodiesterase 2 n=1 Tax=Acipenser ruthenus TaxID=7906 RepID=UPI0027406B4D|nr:tyrosyl-DNA phosphodiesterase 2 [Acipenser ruthenus]
MEDTEDQMQQSELAVVEERNRMCDEFASITSTDNAVAQGYLAENDWDIERAVHSFFEADVETIPCDISPELDSNKKSNMKCGSEPLVCIDLTEEEPASGSSSTVEGGGSKVQTEPEDNSRFSVLTWNIDGLDITNPLERARGICSYIALYSPDVVFLQEVVPPYLSYLKKRAVSYTIVEGNEDCYFTAVMLKKSRVKLLKTEIIPFPSTSMMRNLLTVQASFCGIELHLMTSHLESTKNHSGERINQLKTVLTKIKEAPETSIVIFGGDTNLRDQEVAKIGGLPSNVCDIWEYLGKPEHCRYTWDTKTNHNLQVNYVSRMRFDRVFFRASKGGGQIIPQNMDLIGLEKLDCGKFPSDHWGIYCDFRVVL